MREAILTALKSLIKELPEAMCVVGKYLDKGNSSVAKLMRSLAELNFWGKAFQFESKPKKEEEGSE